MQDVQQPRKSVNPFANLADSLCKVHQIPVPGLARPDGAVRIALVSMPPLDKAEWQLWDNDSTIRTVPPGVDRDDLKRKLVFLKRRAAQKALATYKDALTTAIDDFGAHIICVSELGLPHTDGGPLRAASKFARDLSARRNRLIIAGTGHDKRTLYNTGYVYHPGGDGWGFHKTISASGMGEKVSSPSDRRVLTVKTFGIRVATMICLDVADYATLASVIRVKERVDIILIPCYTEKFDKMVDVAKLASKALRGVVAMANAHIPNQRCHIASFGKDEGPVDERRLASNAFISIFEIDHSQLERARTEAQQTPDPDVDWLFGNGDMPSFVPRRVNANRPRRTRRQ